MQNLRDKLLKAGLVTDKQVQEAAREQKASAPRNRHKQEEQLSAEERQRREAFAAREAEMAEARRKDAARAAEARMQSERARRLRQLVEAHRVREPGEVTFHYVRRSGKIGRLDVSAETQKRLEQGAAAVVEDPGSPDCAVVLADAARRIYEVDPHAIRFWFGPEKPIGFSDAGE
ncbi:MAG TPA: DUF2058 family protein [Myxococcales bacterium]|nr:DUF2058 family protein [Myxococcales bacterium]